MLKNNLFKHSILYFLISLLFPPFAHAYAGPSVAIGVIIIAFTVILAFFSSLIIKIFKAFKYILKKLFNLFSNSKKKSKPKKANKK